ncbi:NB-ARC domain-containing protein [Cladophialophora immunda]|nr:NB-ARC domain-containing protein [Cladophialophora immunda]
MASGDRVMKSGIHRDAIAQTEGIIAFEMEGAGLIDHFPFLVIKGVADYADSHKNDVWHHYASATAACCARAFLENFWTEQMTEYQGYGNDQWSIRGSPGPILTSQSSGVSSSEAPSAEDPTRQLGVWCVSLRRKVSFAGRVNELAALEAMYNKPDCSSISLLGLGGVGKSNLALEFAYSLREKSPDVSIFWVHASDAINFDNGYAEIGRQLQISSMAELQTDLKHLVRQHLSQESFGRWLLIIDNVDDFGLFFGDEGTARSKSLYSFVPRSSRGCTLITTRDRKVALNFSHSHVIEIPCLDQEGALTLLETLLEPAPPALERNLACSLVDRLNYIPLAIVQATAYINLNRIHVSDYLSLLDDKQEETVFELLDEDFEDEVRAPGAKNSIISTWKISFENIARRSPLAQECLARIACIDSKIIPERLLPQVASQKHMIDAVGLLTGYSFLTRRDLDSSNSKTYDMHSLVHLACRSWLHKKSALQTWAPRALNRMLETFPKPDHNNRSAWSLYLPHASRLLQSPHIAHMENRFELTFLVGQCLFLEGKYRDATAKFRLVVEYRERALEPFHPSLLQAYTDLSVALERCSQLEKSLEYGQKALCGYTATLPANHPLVLSAFANIASVKRRQHKWKDALKFDQTVMMARQTVLGENDPDTLSSMANLAASYKSMGSPEKAEELLHRVVEGQRVALGEDDPVFLSSLARLASTYRYSGNLAEAERLALEVLDRRKRVLGSHHPDTLRSMANVGSTWRRQKRWKDAERIESEVLTLRTSILGKEDPHTLTAMGNLAATYRSQGRYDKAEELDGEALKIKERTLGAYDHSTLSTMSSIASTYRKSNRGADADKISKEVLRRCQHSLGDTHPQTLACMAEVAYIYKREGRVKQAASLAEQVLAERERTLDPQNKLVREMRHFLSSLNRQHNRQKERREHSTR